MNTCNSCKHLRNKSMFIPALAKEGPGNPDEPALLSSHCWCNRTLSETGPDDQAVGPQVCQPSRTCFED